MITEIFLFAILLFLIWLKTKKPSSMPPGSYGLPILGALPSGKISITEHMQQLQKKYGNIFTTKWGVHPIVVISDYQLIKKAFKHPDLQGRPQFISLRIMQQYNNTGLIVSTGEVWAESRRFVLHHLRNLGMGKTVLEGSIQDEAALLVDYLEKNCTGKPSVMDLAINAAVVNVIWQMLASKRYDIDDSEGIHYNEHTEGMLEVMQTKLFLLDIFPALHKILPAYILNKFMQLDKGDNHVAALYKMAERIIRAHMETLDPNNPRDLLDQFILQYAEPGSSYSLKHADMKNLINIMTDMFNAGSETTSTTIRWMILYMATHPEIQEKVQKCLDEVVPRSRLPGLADRNQLPYVDAMLLEVLRLSSLVPTGLPHLATADVSFEGYVIPKDTVVMACIRSCQRDDSNWEKADVFNPARFLDENGKLSGKKDNFLPFSIGRRQCLGESLARMQLYLFATAILQRFKIEPPEGVTLSLEIDPSHTIVNQPLPYKVVLTKRN
ncbi:Cytochrome P450 [Trinorchestia longiramus]|nr:Cytochrome P450 [Trinorchestia longiramus]